MEILESDQLFPTAKLHRERFSFPSGRLFISLLIPLILAETHPSSARETPPHEEETSTVTPERRRAQEPLRRQGRYGGEEARSTNKSPSVSKTSNTDKEALKTQVEPSSTVAASLTSEPKSKAPEATIVAPSIPVSQPSKTTDTIQEDASCYSVGDTSDGRLVGCSPMSVDNPAWHFIPAARARDTNYGTTHLISAVRDAAQEIYTRHGNARLLVGNISFKNGGDLPWSVSHNSGRDIDLAFYATDSQGQPVNHDHFIRIGRSGYGWAGDQKVLFDTKRNWELVSNLLQNTKIQVQWVFVYRPLARSLIEYAKESGVDPKLIDRATAVLQQPTDSTPHADHFHVRIFCGLNDILHGCRNTGTLHGDIAHYETERRERVAKLKKQLEDTDANSRLSALKHLRLFQDQAFAPAFEKRMLKDPDPRIREEAFQARFELPAPIKRHHLASLAQNGPNRKKAIHLLGRQGKKDVVPILINLLADDQRSIRDSVRTALRFATNHNLKVPPGEGPAHLRLQKSWRRWLKVNQEESWAQWIREGFEARGIRFGSRMLRQTSIPVLIRTTRRGGHLGYNAQRVLSRITRHWVNANARVGNKAYLYWKKWWRKNHRRYGHRVAGL